MRHILPAIMLVLVCLSNGKCINTEWVSMLDEKYKMLYVGSRMRGDTVHDLTDEDIQNIKDAMGVYEKEDAE